jgi:5-carboxymethyl-2-hydroxymuconate isomerase
MIGRPDMPHFTIEYSANLDARVDMGKVVEVVRKAAVETGIFPIGGIRVRAIRCEHIFKALSSHLDPVFAGSKFALSFDMQINDKETSWKRNNIHEALKVEAAHG